MVFRTMYEYVVRDAMPKELSGGDVEAVRARIGAAATAGNAVEAAGSISICSNAKTPSCNLMGRYRYLEEGEEMHADVRADAFCIAANALEAAFATGGDAFERGRAVGR